MKPEEYFGQRFAELEKEWLAARHLPALFDAVYEAQINDLALPEWAALAVLNMIIDRFNTASGKKNRSKYVLDFVHWRRWDMLAFQFKRRGINYVKKAGPPKKSARGIEAAREEAARVLCTTESRGTPRQMQDSFDLVEKARADGTSARFTFAR